MRASAIVSCLFVGTSAFQLAAPSVRVSARAQQPAMIDSNTLIGAATLLVSTGAGVGLIAWTENRGTQKRENDQLCVDCQGTQVCMCTICGGTGTDPYSDLVSGVKQMTGDGTASNKLMVEDWGGGIGQKREIALYEEVLSRYPVKVDKLICDLCEGRGVCVCDSCEGTGKQIKYLERYSAADFTVASVQREQSARQRSKTKDTSGWGA